MLSQKLLEEGTDSEEVIAKMLSTELFTPEVLLVGVEACLKQEKYSLATKILEALFPGIEQGI